MTIATTARRRFNQAFYLDRDKLVSLWNIINKDGDGSITWGTSDNNEHETDDISHLLNYQNPDSRAVKQIELKGSYKSKPWTVLKFNEHPRIELNISGTQADILLIEDKITRLLEGIFVNSLTITEFASDSLQKNLLIIIGWVGLLVQSIVTTGIIIIIGHFFHFKADIIESVAIIWLLLGNTLLYGFGTVPFMVRLGRRLIPPATFAIGDGISRYNRAAAARHFWGIVVFVGILVATTGGVVASFVYDLL